MAKQPSDSETDLSRTTDNGSNRASSEETNAINEQPTSINGDVKHSDEGRFPILAIDGTVHRWYRDAGEIEILEPSAEPMNQMVKWYFNASPEERKAYKSERMEVRLVTQADIDTIDGKNAALLNQNGVFAKRQLEVGEYLGQYEGALMLTEPELWKRAGKHGIEKVADYSWSLPWQNPIRPTQFPPMLSAFAAPEDPHPIGCTLSNTNAALTETGEYDKELINVEAQPVKTHIGQFQGLICDSVAFVVTDTIHPGQQLFVSYGKGQMDKMSGN